MSCEAEVIQLSYDLLLALVEADGFSGGQHQVHLALIQVQSCCLDFGHFGL